MSTGLLRAAIIELGEHKPASEQRYVDLAIELVHDHGPGKPYGAVVGRVGGRWDRKLRRWDDKPPATCSRIGITDAQIPAMQWYLEWLKEHTTGRWTCEICHTMHLYGARRAGKTIMGAVAALMMAVSGPERIVWVISPVEETDTDEMTRTMLAMAPGMVKRAAGKLLFPNGSVISAIGEQRRTGAREGRVDLVVVNEAQMIGKSRVIETASLATSDSRGLCLLLYNPPESQKAMWLEKLWRKAHKADRTERITGEPATRGSNPAIAFRFDPRKNPYVDFRVLESRASTMDRVSYLRDIEGRMLLSHGDVVFRDFDIQENVRDELPGYRDATLDVLSLLDTPAFEKRLVIGQDFDSHAYMASALMQFWHPEGEALDLQKVVVWVVGALFFYGGEQDGCEELVLCCEELGYRPEECIMIADASGAHAGQNKPPSWPYYESVGFFVEYPSPKDGYRKNPGVLERFRHMRWSIRSMTGRRRLIIHPRLVEVVDALRTYPNKKNRHEPDRDAMQAHICDAIMYGTYRFLSAEARREMGLLR